MGSRAEQHNPDVITTHFMEDRFLNLGEEVILTLLWQSGASESATESMFCYKFKYLLLTFQMSIAYRVSVCVVCVCARGCERETRSHNRSLCTANTYEHHYCICHVTLFPFWAWTDGKTKDIINCLYIYFEKLKLAIMEMGITFPTRACGVRPITMHFVSWPIRADCTCRKEGL